MEDLSPRTLNPGGISSCVFINICMRVEQIQPVETLQEAIAKDLRIIFRRNGKLWFFLYDTTEARKPYL
jgi:hypothetical protein